MEELNYKKGIMYVLSRWAYIVIGVSLAVIIAVCALPVLHKITYIASVDVALSVVEGSNLDENLKQNAQLIFNYNSLIKNDALLSEIIEKNGYNYSINQLKSMIETEILEDTTIVNIKVENSDEIIATQILNDVIDKLREEIQNIYYIDNVHTVKNILVEKTENFKMPIMMVAFIFGGAILSMIVISLIGYLKKFIMLDKNDNQILEINIVARQNGAVARKLKNKVLKRVEISEVFNNIYLFIKKKNSKIIGFMQNKRYNESEKIILEISKNINNKKVLVIKYDENRKTPLDIFFEKEDYYKKKKQLKFKFITKLMENEESMLGLFTSKNNNIDILKFNNLNLVANFACDDSNMESLHKLFEEYDYIFISMNNKIINSGTKILCELCDTIFILAKNYVSTQEKIGEIKSFCTEEKIENLGVITI